MELKVPLKIELLEYQQQTRIHYMELKGRQGRGEDADVRGRIHYMELKVLRLPAIKTAPNPRIHYMELKVQALYRKTDWTIPERIHYMELKDPSLLRELCNGRKVENPLHGVESVLPVLPGGAPIIF